MATKEKRGTVPAAVFITDGPSIVVAHPMGSHFAPLGLDRPAAMLGGGDRLAPDGMPSALGIDHVAGLRNFVAAACRRQATAGRDWYQHPPLALLGERGVGKGIVAHWIARNAGVPLFRVSAAELTVAEEGRSDDAYRAFPPAPVIAMATSCCANPIIVLEIDVDTPPPAVQAVIATMIDPRCNARWIDGNLRTIFDLSHISWIIEVQARTPEPDGRAHHGLPLIEPLLPPALADIVEAAGTVLKVEAPYAMEDLRRLDVAIDVCVASGLALDAATVEHVHASLCELQPSASRHLPCEHLIRNAQHLLALRRSDHAQ